MARAATMEAIQASLIPLLWLVWLIYWMVAARDAKATQRVESAASRAGHLIPLMLAFWLLWSRRVPAVFLGGTILPPSTVLYFAGAAIVAAGLAFAIRARHYLGRNWSGVVTVKQDHELIRGGPYRFVRHPIYTGLLAAFIGSAVARDEWRGVLAVAIAWLALWRKLLLEERWMIEQFGDAYRRFRDEVPALIPNPFRRTGGGGRPA
jgi:protein-S-isoprenylcysteine O-methyltransferase Ste14